MQQLHSVKYGVPNWDALAWLCEASNSEHSYD